MSEPALVEHFFRREYGRVVAALSRRVGLQHLAAVEDAVQSALATALSRWPVSGRPRNPSAWLSRVAHNNLVGHLRQQARRRDLAEHHAASHDGDRTAPAAVALAHDVADDQLRMLFVACDDTLPAASRRIFALKTLCGFSVPEIAQRLFVSEASVYKRLARARRSLAQRPHLLQALDPEQTAARLPTVLSVLYVLFTEGYLSCRPQAAIRRELCDEAIRLAELVVAHPVGDTPQTCALLALMHLHAARIDGRYDGSGGLLLLQEQDRSQWDTARIAVGMSWLARSATGDQYSRFHAEAGIAAEHCLAPSFAATRWDKVAEAYALLERTAPSAIHRLNRALAVAEAETPQAGLAVLQGQEPPTWLSGSYMFSAVLADLHGRCGHAERARRHRQSALSLAPTEAVRALLQRRLGPP